MRKYRKRVAREPSEKRVAKVSNDAVQFPVTEETLRTAEDLKCTYNELHPRTNASMTGVCDDHILELQEMGAMLLLRARQFKNNPNSGLRAGDVFVTKLDEKGGVWSVGETGMDVDTAESCVVLTYDENDFQAKAARYALDLVVSAFAQTSKAIQGANREGREIPVEWKQVFTDQKCEIKRLEGVIASKVTHRWVYKNTDPLPMVRFA